MDGDRVASLALLGMGIDHLSMSVASLPRVKWMIRTVPRARARDMLDEVLLCDSAEAARLHLDQALTQAGMGGLVRGGKCRRCINHPPRLVTIPFLYLLWALLV